ncbi:MAG TPA: SOS response-associated peptidase family protein, partial [Candidatus Binatia bacterium]
QKEWEQGKANLNTGLNKNNDKDLPEFKSSYNIAPGQHVTVIVREEGRTRVKLMRWGLVPS